ncbi:MAG TPA: glycosyltransferase family 1 protein [Candidatus Woesearchaeota archaeon]|nr:glycosyltransferase family 1 protein [Candidatus Woesearchaeota archaeon]
MKVLMFGWEFPPFKTGGLGTACYDLTRGLSCKGVDVTFVMPTTPGNAKADFVKLIGANNLYKNIKVRKVSTILTPYMSSEAYSSELRKIRMGHEASSDVYGQNLYQEVMRYAEMAKIIAEQEEYDLIHAHDWMTYSAGINARNVSGKPFVVHIHATEFDRTGGNPNPMISHLEYTGLNEADLIIANSNFTKNNVIRHYNINPDKIKVVHWGIDPDNPYYKLGYSSPMNRNEKIVLFLGRITIQKGPDYFIEVAKKVLDFKKDVHFVIAGSGDMLPRIIERAVELGISDKVTFTGFLKGADVHRAFQMADLYVMPSTSEPFGLVALESLKNNTPILVSKQSGVSEVVHNALKVDFWDIDEITNKIVNVLNYEELHDELRKNSFEEVQKFDLIKPAEKCIDVYNEAIRGVM